MYELGEEVFTSELPNLYQIWSEAEVRFVLSMGRSTVLDMANRWDYQSRRHACMHAPLDDQTTTTHHPTWMDTPPTPNQITSINQSITQVIDLFGSDAENCFVAEVEGKVAGFCLGTTIEKKHSSCTWSLAPQSHGRDVCCLPI